MRRLLSFACEGAALGATLDAGSSDTGLLLVTGGSQTRIGSHRLYERLSKSLSQQGFPCFRFDRRGVGDSEGEDPGYRGSGPDLAAAAAAFRAEQPGLRRLIGFGLCDGASTIALHGREAGLDATILVNPWLVEAEAGAPPPEAVRRHYRERLFSADSWRRLFGGRIDLGKLWRGLRSLMRRSDPSLAQAVAAALARDRLPAEAILATGDATAIAAEAQLKLGFFNGLVANIQMVESDSHTFARPGDDAALYEAVMSALRRLEGPNPVPAAS